MAASISDPALDSLFLPFSSRSLAWPEGPVLFLRAREGWAMRQFPLAQLVCEQSYKPFADELERGGLQVIADASESDARYPLVLVLPPRQREEARALFARALSLCAPGGVVVASITNNEGAKSGEADLKQLTGLGGSLTKNHCRVFWSKPIDGSPRRGAAREMDGAGCAAPDPGRSLQQPPGRLRLGPHRSGLGVAGRTPSRRSGGQGRRPGRGLRLSFGRNPCAQHEGRARWICTRPRRARSPWRSRISPQFEQQATLGYRWHDVTTGVPEQYDFIVSNPPFHTQSRADRPDVGRRFIAVAAEALKPGGRLFLVANRHLPYEAVLNASFGQVRVAGEGDGFKVIEAIKAMPSTRPGKSAR